jgi:hypothetical protein
MTLDSCMILNLRSQAPTGSTSHTTLAAKTAVGSEVLPLAVSEPPDKAVAVADAGGGRGSQPAVHNAAESLRVSRAKAAASHV